MGIETMGGVYDVVIESNSTIPTKKAKIYSTAADSQPSVEIHILQGERPMARDNRTVGRFILDGIPPAPRGVPQIEVTFDMDANGILKVSAKDKGTGKEQNIRIEASTGLSKEEIERMKNEAAANAESDKIAKDRVEKINQADSVIFQSEKQLKEYGDKIPAEKKTRIEEQLNALKEAHKNQDVTAIEASLEGVNAAWQDASQDMYQASQQGTGAEQGEQEQGQNTANNDQPADVEYEEVK